MNLDVSFLLALWDKCRRLVNVCFDDGRSNGRRTEFVEQSDNEWCPLWYVTAGRSQRGHQGGTHHCVPAGNSLAVPCLAGEGPGPVTAAQAN